MGYMYVFQFLFPQDIKGMGFPRSGIAGSYGGFIPSFLKNHHTVFQSGCIGLHFLPAMQECSLFSRPSPAFFLIYLSIFFFCRLFDDGHSDWCDVVSNHSFNLHFSNKWCWASFHVPVSHLYVFFGEMSHQVPFPLLDCLFFWCWIVWAACIFLKLILYQLFHLLLFSPILRVVFSPCL